MTVLLALLLAQIAGTPGQIQTPNAGRWTSQQGTFLQAGTGAGLRTIESKERDSVSVKDFKGSDGINCAADGSHDDTECIQAAITACPTGGEVFFPATAASYVISSRLNGGSNCNYIGVGTGSKITYKNPSTDNYPMLFLNGSTNVTVAGLNFSGNNSSGTIKLEWTFSEGTINGQEGIFCLNCTDVDIHDNVATNLAGYGFFFLRGQREKIYTNVATGNTAGGIAIVSNDSGIARDDEIMFNTVANNGSFGSTGWQGRGILVNTRSSSVYPFLSAVNTKIVGNIATGNSLYGIESYQGTRGSEIAFNNISGNGFGGIHDWNNSFASIHDNEVAGNGLPNVPVTASGSVLPTQGYGIRVGGCYFCKIVSNNVHDNNNGGAAAPQILVDGEGDYPGAYGNSISLNHVRSNLGSGADINVSASSNNSFPNSIRYYKVVAYDATSSNQAIAISAEISITPAATSTVLLNWKPFPGAFVYQVFRGTSAGAENVGYAAYGNAFLDTNATPPNASVSPPSAAGTITGFTATNLISAVDTFGVLVNDNDMVGTSTASPTSLSTYNTIQFNNPSSFLQSQAINVTSLLNPITVRALDFSSSGLAPTVSPTGAAAVIADNNPTMGSGTNKGYALMGLCKGSSDASGDRCYAGWFKASASNQTSTEVGLHAEVADTGGRIAEFVQGSNAVVIPGALPTGTFNLAVTMGSGTATMTTALIGTLACGATVTVASTGVATTDAISWAFNAIPAANPGELVVSAWPTANNVNFQYCNPTAAGVTPTAATLNWRVVR